MYSFKMSDKANPHVTLLQMGTWWSLLKPDALCLANLMESGLSKPNQFYVFLMVLGIEDLLKK